MATVLGEGTSMLPTMDEYGYCLKQKAQRRTLDKRRKHISQKRKLT